MRHSRPNEIKDLFNKPNLTEVIYKVRKQNQISSKLKFLVKLNSTNYLFSELTILIT